MPIERMSLLCDYRAESKEQRTKIWKVVSSQNLKIVIFFLNLDLYIW